LLPLKQRLSPDRAFFPLSPQKCGVFATISQSLNLWQWPPPDFPLKHAFFQQETQQNSTIVQNFNKIDSITVPKTTSPYQAHLTRKSLHYSFRVLKSKTRFSIVFMVNFRQKQTKCIYQFEANARIFGYMA